ncbi:hypothetical protein ACIBL5_33295 [Streptomyces sp. NPDC050516]|uniref:hypothetical protein n=1 Tax=Streptomyces sp. NPDC050516 TaxID=3365621 RepID=UPI0037BB8B81
MTTPSSSPLPAPPGIPPLPSADPSPPVGYAERVAEAPPPPPPPPPTEEVRPARPVEDAALTQPVEDAAPAQPAEDAGPVVGKPGSAYSSPVDGLVHAAVADRPLEEVVQLITLLEQSPEYARATVDALHAVGMDRSVEDISRLVALLTRPPRSPDSADEAIRAAAECRPVEEVSRLMALLHRSPLERHCGEEAIRAAATNRPVEDLVQLIGRLAEEKHVDAPQPAARASALASASDDPDAALLYVDPPADLPMVPRGAPADVFVPAAARRGRAQTQGSGTPRAWPRWLTSLALVVCSLAYLPLHRGGASLGSAGIDLGVSGLCFLLAVALAFTGSPVVLALGVLVPAALASVQLLEGQLHSRALSSALAITAAPSWVAGLAAVIAVLPALMAVLAYIAAVQPERHPRTEPRPVAEAEQPVG